MGIDLTGTVPLTAAVVLVGNEILSGRTLDKNLQSIALALGERGISVVAARVIPDDAGVIRDTINELRAVTDFVFTTGGIGPTHDDITAENVAAAFGVELHTHPVAERLLLAYFEERGVEPNEARMRMARVPTGAELIDNPVSVAPGFRMDNVYVMAGVPKIMQAMLDNILPTLPSAPQLQSITVICNLPEGTLAQPLEELQNDFPMVDIGSYPGNSAAGAQKGYRVALVARAREQDSLRAVEKALVDMVARLGGAQLDA